MILLLLVLLFLRIKRDKVLDHFVRGQIYGYIVANPGTTYTEIKNKLKVKNGTLTYHLYLLEKMGFVKSERMGKFKTFYPAKMPEGTKRGMILSKIQEKIVSCIKSSPGIGISEMAKKLEIKKQNVSYNVIRLKVLGLVRIEGFARKHCYLKEARASKPSE